MSDVTRILEAIEEGDSRAVDQLLPAVYEELRTFATQKLAREKRGQTLQATALVHEVYLRLVGTEGQNWRSRTHFFAATAEAMRRILVDNACYDRRFDRSYLVFGRMAELSGRSIIIGHEGNFYSRLKSSFIRFYFLICFASLRR